MKFFEHFVDPLECFVHIFAKHDPQSLQWHRLSVEVFTRSLQHGVWSTCLLWPAGRWWWWCRWWWLASCVNSGRL